MRGCGRDALSAADRTSPPLSRTRPAGPHRPGHGTGIRRAAACVAIFLLRVPFSYIVVAAGLIGLVGGHSAPWSRSTWRTAIVRTACGLALWVAHQGSLYLTCGPAGTLTRMGWFFTRAALVSFGGAYAVLPYLYQSGVDHYGWLTGTQMIDGLALGESRRGRSSWSLRSSALWAPGLSRSSVRTAWRRQALRARTSRRCSPYCPRSCSS